MLEIADKCLEINEEIKERRSAKYIEELSNLFYNDYKKFIEDERINNYSPFWILFDVKKVYRKVKKLENIEPV